MPFPDDLAVALSRLGAAGHDAAGAIRPVLLRTVVELFLQRATHSRSELKTFEAMVGPLLDQADPGTRRAVAEKLFGHPDTPQSLLDRLIDNRMLAAAEAYRHAPLDDADLLAAAERGPVTVAVMVAYRQSLSAGVIEALAARPEPLIARALAANRAVELTPAVFLGLVQRARDEQDLAVRLASRATDPIDVAPLFPVLGPEPRGRIIAAVRRHDLGRREWGRPDGATAATLARLDRLVLGGEWEGFDDVLAQSLGHEPMALGRLLHDGTGDILALALAGVGAPGELAARAFILGDPAIGRSVAAVRRLTALVDAVAPSAARRLVGAMLPGGERVPRRPAVPAKPVPAGRRIEQAVSEPLPARREVPEPIRRRV